MVSSSHEDYLVNHCLYERYKQEILYRAKKEKWTDEELCRALREILVKYGLYQKED